MLRMWVAASIVAGVIGSVPGPAAPTARVLFIGNSLTYANGLPEMVASISGGEVATEMVALPDYSLEDHWRRGDALRKIRQGGWTHVVLQQGPSSLPESRRALVQQARRYAREIKKAGAEVLLYGVWPPASRRGAFDAVTGSYAAAARESGGTLVAAGEGWRAAWETDASLPLYGPDGFHPSPLGTYVAAVMFSRHVSGRPPAEPEAPAYGATLDQLRIAHTAALGVSASRVMSR